MTCKNCGADRIIEVSGKTADMCFVRIDGREHDGYVPEDMGIGGGDYLEIDFCLECGMIQSEDFPVDPSVVDDLFDRRR
jgi:hypothetical protein